MRRFVQALSMIAALSLFLFPPSLRAQDRAPWALEASVIYNNQSYKMSEMKQNLDDRKAHEIEWGHAQGYSDPTFSNEKSFESLTAIQRSIT